MFRLSRLVGYVCDTPLRTAIAVVVVGVAVGLFNFGVDRALIELEIGPDLHSGVQAAIAGVGAAVATLWILLAIRERRRRIADELSRVAELNHTLRNALEVIIGSHYPPEEQHNFMVLESAKRIDAKLKELFPALGVERRERKRFGGGGKHPTAAD